MCLIQRQFLVVLVSLVCVVFNTPPPMFPSLSLYARDTVLMRSSDKEGKRWGSDLFV